MKLIGFHPDADAEVTEAARYYAVRKSGLGSDLPGEVERARAQILTNPEVSKANRPESAAEVLVAVSYNLIYAVYPDRIRILACAHQKRRPFYWRNRLQDTAARGGSVK